jgi:hypothetical protein
MIVLLCLSGCNCGSIFKAPANPNCPEQQLTAAQVEALTKKGLAANTVGKSGEYHLTTSLEKGLPMLKRAALHGAVDAMSAYSGHLIQMGIVDPSGSGILGLSDAEVAEEAMLFMILEVHLGRPYQSHDAETYRVLLDPSVPFPEGFFQQSGGTGWMMQMLSPASLDRARRQAFHWRACWKG